MVLLYEFSPLYFLALIIFLSLLIDDARIVHEKLIIVKFFDYEFHLKLIVRIEEELKSHEKKCIGQNVKKLLHCGQSDSLSFIRHDQHHSFEKGRSHQSISELDDLPLSHLLILFFHILSPQNYEQFQEGKTHQGLELLEDHVQKGHDFGVAQQLLTDPAFLAMRAVDVIFLDILKCLLKCANLIRRHLGFLVTKCAFILSLEQTHIIPYIFFEDELMLLHETHLEVFISPRLFCLLLLSLFLSILRSAIAHLRLQMIFYLLGFFGPKRQIFLVKAEKMITVAVQVSHLMQIVIAHCPSF